MNDEQQQPIATGMINGFAVRVFRGEGTDAARRREALNHPAVNSALEILDGEILEIRPLGSPP